MKFKKVYNENYSAMQYLDDKPQIGRHANTLAPKEVRVALDASLPNGFSSYASNCVDTYGTFPGYAFLQQMSQNALISAGVETTANEMTREWVEITYKGTADNDTMHAQIVQELSADLIKFNVQEIFRDAAAYIGYYGGCLVSVNNGTPDDLLDVEMFLDPATFKIGSLKSFALIDPINCYPGLYNSNDPTKPDYFKPNTWWVQSKNIHKSRLLYFVGKEAPLLYKPTYNFFGISQAQMAWDYVVNFTQNKESAARLLNKFSLTVYKTNMTAALSGEDGGIGSVENRVDYFVQKQNNDGMLLVDKEQEDIVKLDTNLGGVTDIVRQALELVSTIFRMPATKFLGISPAGFNATGEYDESSFYDHVKELQQDQLRKNLDIVLQILQLNRYGKIDPNICIKWRELGKEDKNLESTTQKTRADTIAVYHDRGIISTEESRQLLSEEKDSPFSFVDPSKVPDIQFGENEWNDIVNGANIDDVDKAGAVY